MRLSLQRRVKRGTPHYLPLPHVHTTHNSFTKNTNARSTNIRSATLQKMTVPEEKLLFSKQERAFEISDILVDTDRRAEDLLENVF